MLTFIPRDIGRWRNRDNTLLFKSKEFSDMGKFMNFLDIQSLLDDHVYPLKLEWDGEKFAVIQWTLVGWLTIGWPS
jgi:hypothetical protein